VRSFSPQTKRMAPRCRRSWLRFFVLFASTPPNPSVAVGRVSGRAYRGMVESSPSQMFRELLGESPHAAERRSIRRIQC
jgi:hypothetical protein